MKTLNHMVPLRVSQIHPHPDNPRKELGDLSELTQSIKENGILQEITVIPKYCLNIPKEDQGKPGGGFIENPENEYYILMGHRRFAAFKAGYNFSDLKCKIAYEISRSEQIGIMLEENVQRNELTVPEQIESFQLMLDLGETVESISEKTGFSRSTIYKRIKNADVVEELKEADHQLTIADMEELAKVETEDKLDILNRAKTSNDIKYYVNEKIKIRERVKKQDALIEKLIARGVLPYDEEAKKLYPNWWGLDYVCEIRLEGDEEKLESLTGDEYFNELGNYSETIVIRRPEQEEEPETEEDIKERERREAVQEKRMILIEVTDKLETQVISFIRSLAAGELNIAEGFTYSDAEQALKDDEGVISIRNYMAHILDKSIWNITKEEKENFYENHIVDFRIMVLDAKSETLEDTVNYDGTFDRENGEYWEDMLIMADAAGFKVPDIKDLEVEGFPEDETLEDVLNGTSELYIKEDPEDE